jgi:TonB family protein
VDPAALQRAQDEARRRSEAEQARKQQEEKKRLEEEQKAAEARLAEEQRKEEEARLAAAAAAAAAAATMPAATQPPAPPPTVAALKPGTLVQLSDPGVIAPVPLATPALQYPPIALARRIEGKVEVSVLVDERGTVAETKLVSGAGGKSGLNEAALENARRRRYRPASKDGVPVKVWVAVTVNFMLPK